MDRPAFETFDVLALVLEGDITYLAGRWPRP